MASPQCFMQCRATIFNAPVLASGHLNVMVPTMRDLADSLPSTWKADICNCKGETGATHPNQQWLDRFWGLVNSSHNKVPSEMSPFVLVPITGNRLASVAHCASTGTLSHRHLQGLPSNAVCHWVPLHCRQQSGWRLSHPARQRAFDHCFGSSVQPHWHSLGAAAVA